MDLSQPLITPEELSCLLGWPLPVGANDSPSVQAPAAPGASTPGTADLPLAMAG